MELKDALAEVRKGKIVFDGGKSMKYFLFMGRDEELYLIHNKTINVDKMRIAELEKSQPDLLAENWWKDEWEVWNAESTKTAPREYKLNKYLDAPCVANSKNKKDRRIGKIPWNKGKKATEKQLEALKIGWNNKEGSKNPKWKGDEVGNNGLHEWIRRHKPKPRFCENCELEMPYDLANVSGKYLRDINDFKWLCRSCHMKGDDRIYNLKQFQSKGVMCVVCGQEEEVDSGMCEHCFQDANDWANEELKYQNSQQTKPENSFIMSETLKAKGVICKDKPADILSTKNEFEPIILDDNPILSECSNM